MDNLTHGLLGYCIYAMTKKEGMEKHKRSYALSAIIGAELPDIDAYTFGNLQDYLSIHRGITHSISATPFLAFLACGLVYLFAGKKRTELSFRRLYVLAALGVCSHWLFDWCNTWGTGLLEPLVHNRYSLGFLPIVDIVLLLLFGAGFILRRFIGSKKAFRIIGCFIIVYLLTQASQNLWIKHQVATNYDQVTVAASFVPGEFTVIGRHGSTFEIYSKSLFSEGTKTIIKSNDNPLIVKKALQNETARTIAWWSPFYAITLDHTGNYALVFDPRFYRNGESFVKAVVHLAGD